MSALADPPPKTARRRPPGALAILALMVSVLLLTAGTNLQGVLLPIRRQMEGASMQHIGLLSSGWSFGFVLACLVVGRLVSAVGHVRSFAGLAAVSAAMALLLLPLNREVAWIALRVIIGFCFGGLSMIIESWLNEQSASHQRGGIFAAYMTVTLLASLAGTFSLSLFDPMDTLPYTLMGVAVVLSIVPVTLIPAPVPADIEPFPIDLGALYRLSPTGVVGCFAAGLVGGALGGLLPAYGLSMNLSTHGVATLLAAALVGGALAYYPAGALSDKVDRRLVIIALSVLSAVICGVLEFRPYLSPGMTLAAVGVYGFFQYPLYGICVAMTNDRVREQSFSEVASELLIIYGTGTVIGPPLAVALMRYGARHLFLFMGIVLVFLAVFTGIRLMRRARPAREPARKSHPFEAAPNTMRLFRPNPVPPTRTQGPAP